MTDRELFEKALEAMEHLNRTGDTQVFDLCYAPELIPALKERLAQPEPVIDKSAARRIATALGWEPRREWVGLTDGEKAEIQSLKWWDWEDAFDLDGYTRAIEAKLKEKNT